MAAEASIPEASKLYCPYPKCSTLMVADERGLNMHAECPACHRMLCLWCRTSGIRAKPVERQRYIYWLCKRKETKWSTAPFGIDQRVRCVGLPSWAARCKTWRLIKMTLKGIGFLFFSFLGLPCRPVLQLHEAAKGLQQECPPRTSCHACTGGYDFEWSCCLHAAVSLRHWSKSCQRYPYDSPQDHRFALMQTLTQMFNLNEKLSCFEFL